MKKKLQVRQTNLVLTNLAAVVAGLISLSICQYLQVDFRTLILVCMVSQTIIGFTWGKASEVSRQIKELGPNAL